MNIRCYRCKKNKSTKEFSRRDNGVKRKCWQGYCKPCVSKYYKALPAQKKKKYGDKYRNKVKNIPEYALRTLLRSSAVDRSQLDYDWAWNKMQAQDMCCEVTGAKFVFATRDPQSLSIDRIDASKGYTKDNVRFVCWWVNAAMGNWGLDKLDEMIKEWKNV